MKKKYNCTAAIAMVVGIIIGAGVFFKSGAILKATGGNLWLGMLSWVIGGILIISSAYAFAILTNDFNISGGINEYAGKTLGKKYGYYTGYYLAIIYFPCITAVLAWLSSKYTLVLFNVDSTIWTISLSFIYLIGFTLLNIFAPIISGKLQISTTILKLIPLIFIAVVGLIYGIFNPNGLLLENFTHVTSELTSSGMWQAICATVFAYEGWICVTSINNEMENSKKNFPKALIIGAIICILTYILYLIGIAGIEPTLDLINNPELTILNAFTRLLGSFGGPILYTFVLISGLGCLNGLCIANIRGLQNLADYNEFKGSNIINNKKTKKNLSYFSSLIGLFIAMLWLAIWFLFLYNVFPIFIDVSELAIVYLYLFYIPIYIYIIIKNKNAGIVRRYIIPVLAIIASIIILVSGIMAHGIGSLIFIIAILFIMLIAVIIKK